MKILSLVLCFCLCVVSLGTANATPELKGSPEELRRFLQPEKKTISVTGQAEEKAYSDLAHVSLQVTTEEKTLTAALQANSEIRQMLTRTFTQAGIPADRIKNSKFSSSPQYGWFGKEPSEYEVVNSLKVTIANEAQMTLLSKAADDRDEVKVGTIEFEHSEKKQTQQQVRDDALEEAMTKAQGYADKLSLVLTPVSFHFHENTPRPRQSRPHMQKARSTLNEVTLMSDAESASAPTVSFDEIQYEARVDVVFEIAPKTP